MATFVQLDVNNIAVSLIRSPLHDEPYASNLIKGDDLSTNVLGMKYLNGTYVVVERPEIESEDEDSTET